MKVENHGTHFMKIPIMAKGAAGQVFETDKIDLFPGVNEVDPEKWAKVEKYGSIVNLIALGPKRGGLTVDAKKSLKTLEKVSEREALDLIEECVDKKLLQAWFLADKRAEVLEALSKQLDAIEPNEARAAKLAAAAQ